MKGALIGCVLAALMASVAFDLAWSGTGCTPTPPVPPAPPVTEAAPPETPYERVYNALVDAGCIGVDINGPQAIEDEAQFGDPWLVCLLEGGTVPGCNTPCGPSE